MITTRRSFITTAVALFCAPAIVRASSLMPVKAEKIEAPKIFIMTESQRRLFLATIAAESQMPIRYLS